MRAALPPWGFTGVSSAIPSEADGLRDCICIRLFTRPLLAGEMPKHGQFLGTRLVFVGSHRLNGA